MTGLLRSQSGPLTGMNFSTVPTHPLNRIDSQEFRVLLLRRLRLPLPLSSRRCRCGRLLHSYGHHRALCHSRGFGQAWVRGRECRSTNVPRGERQGVDQCGCAIWTCQCPSMMDVVWRAWLMGYHSMVAHGDERNALIRSSCDLAKRQSWWSLLEKWQGVGQRRPLPSWDKSPKHAREANLLCCRRGWSRRGDFEWGSLLACAAGRAFACSLLKKRVPGGADGDTPSVHEVLESLRWSGGSLSGLPGSSELWLGCSAVSFYHLSRKKKHLNAQWGHTATIPNLSPPVVNPKMSEECMLQNPTYRVDPRRCAHDIDIIHESEKAPHLEGACTAWSAGCWPREKRAGLRGSLCPLLSHDGVYDTFLVFPGV